MLVWQITLMRGALAVDLARRRPARVAGGAEAASDRRKS